MSAMKLSSPQTPVQTNKARSEEPHQTSVSLVRMQTNLHMDSLRKKAPHMPTSQVETKDQSSEEHYSTFRLVLSVRDNT
jgi:hypothetical protein